MPMRVMRSETRAFAEQYFAAWRADAERSIERLSEELEAEGHDPLGDRLPAGMTPAWTWIAANAEQVPELIAGQELPPWQLPGPPTPPFAFELSPRTLWRLDALAHHFAAVVELRVPGVAWRIGDEPAHRQQYSNQHWPILVGEQFELNPLIVVGQTYVAVQRDLRWDFRKFATLVETAATRAGPRS